MKDVKKEKERNSYGCIENREKKEEKKESEKKERKKVQDKHK